MTPVASLFVVLAAYLLGSISFSYVIVRVLEGIDIRTVGSGNAGATNVMRAAGKGPALVALGLDVGKGVAAVLLARWLGAPPMVVGLAALAVALGHVYPIFLGFRGGKAVATAGGALGVLVWQATLAAFGVFLLVFAWRRIVSLASISAAASVPLFVVVGDRLSWFAEGEGVALLATTAAIALLVLFKHRENIGRLRRGEEPRFGERS